ncbi:hypothetical protein TGGT1_314885 [Toxoplasma gondii GT1]|uniref:Transmembrane protein n=2 Tax=Toxoplasma gondii TaxID=5811 RepID=S7UM96_TOXGG|nr:hypothetical protein TGGT1_314885 [Toxoplasma gondii GT1]KAF4639615.1 hypothetical protein TGRH88_053870 [Toxoplasma gondii]
MRRSLCLAHLKWTITSNAFDLIRRASVEQWTSATRSGRLTSSAWRSTRRRRTGSLEKALATGACLFLTTTRALPPRLVNGIRSFFSLTSTPVSFSLVLLACVLFFFPVLCFEPSQAGSSYTLSRISLVCR